jgi:hypothetical protein
MVTMDGPPDPALAQEDAHPAHLDDDMDAHPAPLHAGDHARPARLDDDMDARPAPLHVGDHARPARLDDDMDARPARTLKFILYSKSATSLYPIRVITINTKRILGFYIFHVTN